MHPMYLFNPIMKTIYTLIFLLFIIVTATYAQNVTGRFTLNGTIKRPNVTKAILIYNATVIDEYKYIQVSDSVEVSDNDFVFSGYLAEPVMAKLQIGGEELRFAIEPSVMTLTIPDTDPDSFILEGSRLHTHVETMGRIRSGLYEKIAEIRGKIADPNEQDEGTVKKNQQALDSLNSVLSKADIVYAKENPDYFFGIQMLGFQMRALSFGINTAKEARDMFNSFSPEFRQTLSGKITNILIKSRENTQAGGIAPEFSVKDIDGNTIDLSRFSNKRYVLIDAWASWCAPCVKSIPHVKELYNKYHDKGLEVIAISRDEDLQAWRNAINKYETQDWHHILAEKEPGSVMKGHFIEDDIMNLYPIFAIPKYFLIDMEGVVIGSWDGAGKKNMNELDQILARIFVDD